MSNIIYKGSYPVERRNFENAGHVSSEIKRRLKQLGASAAIVRDVAIASYELEINLIIHSMGGELILEIAPDRLELTSLDIGPGIADIDLVMQEGYSTASEDVRMMGFGAGMGLPNVKRHSHDFSIESKLGEGTKIVARYNL